MTLDQYFMSEGAMSRAELCEAIGITQGRLSQIRFSDDIPPKLALAIEKQTRGALSASDLSSVVRAARA